VQAEYFDRAAIVLLRNDKFVPQARRAHVARRAVAWERGM
jgi:hypothetical protein